MSKLNKKQLKLFNMTVEEVKDNAEYNLKNSNMPIQVEIGMRQLENYNISIKLGAKDEDEWENWEEKVKTYKDE